MSKLLPKNFSPDHGPRLRPDSDSSSSDQQLQQHVDEETKRLEAEREANEEDYKDYWDSHYADIY